LKKEQITMYLPEGSFYADVLRFEEKDRKILRDIYYHWRSLCDELSSMEGRNVNLPEGLSESAFCLEMNTVRLTSPITGANTSFDCYRISDHKRIQVKACSVLPDLTSFGPKSVWDEIYFADFYRKGKWDGTFDIYKIDNDLIYNHKVNSNQTLRDQQMQRRRPRFSIYKNIILPYNMKPIKTGKL